MMSAIDWAKFCTGMQWGDVRVDSEGSVTETPVAHAMSQAEAVQHVSAAAAAAYAGTRREAMEHVCRLRGVVLRTVAEWQEMELRERTYHDVAHKALGERDDLRSQLAAKTAECERLQVAMGKLMDDNERLREGREDGQNHGDVSERNRECGSVGGGVRPSACGGLATLADNLDPRLGVQQPEGEPGEPMPYWRRSGV